MKNSRLRAAEYAPYYKKNGNTRSGTQGNTRNTNPLTGKTKNIKTWFRKITNKNIKMESTWKRTTRRANLESRFLSIAWSRRHSPPPKRSRKGRRYVTLLCQPICQHAAPPLSIILSKARKKPTGMCQSISTPWVSVRRLLCSRTSHWLPLS